MSITLEQLWAKHSFSPNPKQREAILSVDGPLYLTAGPGSGKTRVLLWRTVNLIVVHGVPPNEIFLGTFTEKAAHQLREGLRTLLGAATHETGEPYDISRMAIGTIHSICHTILLDRRLSPSGQRPKAHVLLDQFAQHQFVYKAKNWKALLEASGLSETDINGYFGARSRTSRHEAVVSAISFFNRCSEEAIDPAAHAATKDETAKRLLAMYRRYRELLEEDVRRPRTDLSLLQYHAYQRLLNAPQSDSMFRHVIIDEYQDTNTIQERIYFHLARTSKNLCVVGDDDQAMYRFRGATVDNFLAFPDRCKKLLGSEPKTIPLVTNYRSRKGIVGFYNAFMARHAWKRGSASYRVDKQIEAGSKDSTQAVYVERGAADDVAANVAATVADLIKRGRVKDPNEVAFLFPSLKSKTVTRLRDALDAHGLKVYAPRAGRFIEVPEAMRVFGVFAEIFEPEAHSHQEFDRWIRNALGEARKLSKADPRLARFIALRKGEVAEAARDEAALLSAARKAGIAEDDECTARALAVLARSSASEECRRFLQSGSLDAYMRHQRERRPDRVITVRYVINRACTLDWGLLDLFYQLTTFDAFKQAFDDAEKGVDEGPICNLSMVSDYIARFQEQTSPVITARSISEKWLARQLFGSFLYTVFRLEEGEFEDKQDPFPKGRIPFLTVHQAKGLEFPVVVMGNLRKGDNGPRPIETLMAQLGVKKREPLDIAGTLDIARMFYVGLSRPKQALILCAYEGKGQRFNDEFKAPMDGLAKPLKRFDVMTIDPHAEASQAEVPKPYSFTGDYISYSICPRRYMLYRRYHFVPSRSQTTIFGNLVHQTIEDLHQHFIHLRAQDAQRRSA